MSAHDDFKQYLLENPRLSFDEARNVLRYCDSFSRLPTLLDIQWRMDDEDFLRLLGEEWSGCDNIGQFSDDLFNSPMLAGLDLNLGGGVVKRAMMTPSELLAYDRLPDVVTIYRGCYQHNKWGWSWSLSEETAREFPTLNRYRHTGQPLLVTARVRKSDIIALKLDREESEVIAWRPKHVSTKHIKAEIVV